MCDDREDSNSDDSWGRFRGARFSAQAIPVVLDLSGVAARVSLEDSTRTVRAAKAMRALERGAIANSEESRMVGHYWLRAPGIAPTEEIVRDISDSVDQICRFASDIASGVVKAPAGSFLDVLHVGIGAPR
jgi:glucose-6-phosphate isomerase